MLNRFSNCAVFTSRKPLGKLCYSLLVLSLIGSTTLLAQVPRQSTANSQAIDPVKPGDQIEVKPFQDWIPGTVLSYENGKASVEYMFAGSPKTQDVTIDKLRFPNGEGHWMLWRDASGKIKQEARYIARDQTTVMLRLEDGSDLTLAIDSLALDLRQRVKALPITGEENKIDGAEPVKVGDRVQVRMYATRWSDGIVKRLLIGEAEVDFEEHGRTATKVFRFPDIRFPNGEGHWRQWSDKSGAFKIIARYISRTETDVTIRKEDGTDITVPINRLAPSLVKLLAATPVTGKENVVDGVNLVRIGDAVQVRKGSDWEDGVIVESLPGAAMVECKNGSIVSTDRYELKDVRYPNGEGPWQKWSDSTGSSVVVARFLRRTATHVFLLKEDGKTVSVPIDRLHAKHKRTIEQSLTITTRPEKVEFAMSPRTVTFMSGSSGPPQLPLQGTSTERLGPTKDGGFGFQLTHGDTISAVVALAGEDPWVVVGTHASDRFNGEKLTRLYWTKPTQQKSIPGPNFLQDERIIDYSASQGRLITMQVSEGYWEQPKMFCSYRLKEGEAFAEPEFAWDIAEKKESFGRGSNYMARLVGDNQLLLADGNAVSLYDFGTRQTVFTLSNLKDSHFTLHPSKKYFAVVSGSGGFSIHNVESGQQVAGSSETGALGFSQDGNQLICVGLTSVWIWNLLQPSSPMVLQTRNLTASSNAKITMLNSEWLWVDSSIYSTNKEIVVWNYTGGGVKIAHSEILGDRLLVAGTGGSYGNPTIAYVGVAKVPHDDAIREMKKANTDAMIMLKPGAGIRLNVPSDDRIRAGIMKAITANGWHEDPDSEIVLTASAQQGKTEQVTYERSRFLSHFGMRGTPISSETVSVTPWVQLITISFRDSQVWSRGMGGVPYSIQLKENETVSGAVAAATQPSYSLFQNPSIPEEILYPQYRSGLGQTAITANGFVDKVFEIQPAKVN